MKTKIILLMTVSILAACAAPTRQQIDAQSASLAPPTLGGPDILRLEDAPPAAPSDFRIAVTRSGDDKAEGLSVIREKGLTEAAQTYGSQAGYARRAWEIMHRLEGRSVELSQVFDFRRVTATAPVGAGVIIPPVVSRTFDAFQVDAGGTEANVAEEYLHIQRPGRIAPLPPTWRDYLLFAAPGAEEPAKSLMPSDSAELKAFRGWFEEGWQAGVSQADAEFADRLARLQRDYTGMLQYRRLVSQGMMDRMVLADADFGVTGSGDEMRIGSRMVRLVSEASFQTNPQKWRLANIRDRDALVVATGHLPGLSGN